MNDLEERKDINKGHAQISLNGLHYTTYILVFVSL